MNDEKPDAVWYRAMRRGKIWCEGSDPGKVRDSGGDELLLLDLDHLRDGWQPWDGTVPASESQERTAP